ncbi:hypothetical protein SUGI_0128730 [Cryptomeria japonica]|nr:hypothetical protein SUGI_0128730 [Cryptomeria japonica]
MIGEFFDFVGILYANHAKLWILTVGSLASMVNLGNETTTPTGHNFATVFGDGIDAGALIALGIASIGCKEAPGQ